MDLLLAHAYLLKEDPLELRVMKPYAPLGILYLSAWLKKSGFSVGVYDATFRSRDEFVPTLQEHQPRVVGIYVNMMTKRHTLRMIQEARASGARVVLGGPEPRHHAHQFLDRGADVSVVGEGEETLAELLPALEKSGVHHLHHIAGIFFRDDSGQVVQTPERPRLADINLLPWPDRDAIDLTRYLETWRIHHGASSLSLITARGCPFTCSWCSHAVYGHSHRRRRPEGVVDEIAYLRERWNPDQLWIADDVFTVNKDWIHHFQAELKRRHITLPYECISRADRLSEEVADLLQQSGCRRLWVGSESGSQRILDEMSRGVTVEEVRQGVKWLQQRGIEAGLFIMVGYGDETEAEIVETIQHLKITNPDQFLITVAYPITGTTYHHDLNDKVISPLDWDTTTDRDKRFTGRPSDRYYRFATSRIHHEVALHRALHTPTPRLRTLTREWAATQVARVGMALTRRVGRWSAP